MILSPTTLKKMDWKLFEELTAEILRLVGYQAEVTKPGPDGCIDVIACTQTEPHSKIAVQCKRYSGPIAVKQVREFFGAMMSQGYEKGIFITTSSFNQRTVDEFSGERRLELIDGLQILEGIDSLGEIYSAQLNHFTFGDRPDWDIQTCAICGEKMVIRSPRVDQNWKPFWGCQNFGKTGCRGRLAISNQ